MPPGRSRNDFLAFLDQQVEQGVLPTNTAISRRSSIGRVLEQLSDEECADVTALNLDEIMKKFQARSQQNYNIATIVSYKSRLQSALKDFSDWSGGTIVEAVGRTRRRIRPVPPAALAPWAGTEASSLAIQIRKGWAVRVENLPHDLTQAEAERIANAILSYVYPDKGGS